MHFYNGLPSESPNNHGWCLSRLFANRNNIHALVLVQSEIVDKVEVMQMGETPFLTPRKRGSLAP